MFFNLKNNYFFVYIINIGEKFKGIKYWIYIFPILRMKKLIQKLKTKRLLIY